MRPSPERVARVLDCRRVSPFPSLPIDERLAEICAVLRRSRSLVLVAEPGAGKTTRVPQALLAEGFAERGEIVVLEPRRLAARMAAHRVAEELGERVGERVGYQVRFDDVSSARTRIRFVTEGILTRRLSTDPELVGVATVVLDELHERHLHGDVALALLARLRATSRPDLHVVAMSATIDADPVARFLSAPVITVAGRRFDVAIEFAERDDERHLDVQVAGALRRLVRAGLDGDVLVFLPGASEIRRARDACDEIARSAELETHLLHGDLPSEEQDRAVRPSQRRKLILSTNVAESSLTIPGVAAVIDSGLARRMRHSPWSGLPGLSTEKVSRASAMQRAGRAGRLRAGRCVRLYTRLDHDARPAFEVPEIRRADLAETLLSLRASGLLPTEIAWLEAPPDAAREAAENLLARLGAIDSTTGALTLVGRKMSGLPLHPRLARLVLEAASRGAAERGCLAAALVGEREVRVGARGRMHGGPAVVDEVGSSDLLARVEAIEAVETSGGLRADRLRAHGLDAGAVAAAVRARNQIVRALGRSRNASQISSPTDEALLIATLTAFPDRVARRRSPRSNEVVFAGGGSARLAETSVVRDAELLVVVEADERKGAAATVRMASAIEPEWLLDLYSDRLTETRTVRFDPAQERVEVVSALSYEGLVLDEHRSERAVGEDVERALADAALSAGPSAFADADADAIAHLRARVAFVAGLREGLPQLDEAAMGEALRSLCVGKFSFAELRRESLLEALRARLPPSEMALVNRWAPERVTLPGGRRVAVNYPAGEASAQTPFIASRLQDFFGLREGPRIAEGRVPLVLHLLAPNQRAVQVTTDLAGFWVRHYPALRNQLMRRYPRHSWPDDPLTAAPRPPRR